MPPEYDPSTLARPAHLLCFIDCWAAEGVGGRNRREIGFGVDWHRSRLLALRGAAVGGIGILLPNPSNHFQLSWTEKCTQERVRRKMVGRVGQGGQRTRCHSTPPHPTDKSHASERRRGVGLASDGKSTQWTIVRAPGECGGTIGTQ